MTKIIFIEGGISSGKTTIIDQLRKTHKVYEEPLDSWLNDYKDEENVNILELFYRNMKEYGFKFEVMSMVTRYKQLIKAIKNDELVIIERSYLSCRKVFAQNLYNDKLLDELEWKLYTEAHDMFHELIQLVLDKYEVTFIYLRTTPDVCFARKNGRDRKEENTVTPIYFNQLHDLHDKWLLNMENVVVVNGDKTKTEIINDIKKIID